MADVFLPILRDTKDPHYRYKMPKLLAKVEGSGNGIKTVIVNMTQIAKALGRPPSYPTKFFGCELGAQVTMDHDTYIVNGAHDPEKLLSLLYAFIRKFVLCNKCNNPETVLTVQNQAIRARCAACGNDFTIPKTMHKLTTFIINHPPEVSSPYMASNGTSTTTKTVKSSSKKSSKHGKNGSNAGGGNSPTNGQDGDEFGPTGKDEFDDDGFDDAELTKEAFEERMRGLCDGLNGAMRIKDSAKENADLFYNSVKRFKEQELVKDVQAQKDLYAEAVRLELKDKATLILCELLFTENIIEEIKLYKMVFLRFCHKNEKAQKYLLGGFEKLVGDVYKDKLFASIPKVLKQFYDEDILDEETLLEWGAKESKKYVSKDVSKKIHEKAAPFIKWLKEAEEEDDDDDDDYEEPAKGKNGKSSPTNGAGKKGAADSADEDDEDDDLEVDFTFKAGDTIKIVDKQTSAPASSTATKVGDDKKTSEEDDIDIDNI